MRTVFQSKCLSRVDPRRRADSQSQSLWSKRIARESSSSAVPIASPATQESRPEGRLTCEMDKDQLKMAPTVALVEPSLTVQLLGPAALIVAVGVQLKVHPPKATPVWAGAVKVTVVPMG